MPGGTGALPLVTCVMPTADRPGLVGPAIDRFLRQDYPNRELIVLDAGRETVRELVPRDPSVHYRRVSEPMSLGALRNLGCRDACGELILHWDDDDWMAPWRIRYQVGELLRDGADICGLDRLYFVGPHPEEAWEYIYPKQELPWLAGGTFCYRKDFWVRNPFPDLTVGEDNFFVWSDTPKRLLALEDRRFYVATIHASNTSPKQITPDRWRPVPPGEVRAIVGPDWGLVAQILGAEAPPRAEGRPAVRGPLVSCVMATGDRPDFVRQAIRCFLRQTYLNAEMVVVDDGRESVEELCEGIVNVRHVRCPGPMNLGAKLNLGIENARGDIIQKIDDDDYYGAVFLEQAVGELAGVAPGEGLVAWCCFLVLLPGEDHPRFSGHGWAAGASLSFHRKLWERTPFRDVPKEVDKCFLEDAGVEVRRVCAPESLLVVRHDDHTWKDLPDETSVEDYFRRMPVYPRPVSEVVEPIDRPFYRDLVRGRS